MDHFTTPGDLVAYTPHTIIIAIQLCVLALLRIDHTFILLTSISLNRPDNCPDDLHDLMSKCHIHEASKRPSFSEILSSLTNEPATYEVPTTKET